MTIKPSPKSQLNKVTSEGSIFLRDYMHEIEPTDKLPTDDLHPVLMGLFGEVGSIMATAKKNIREKAAYAGYQKAVEEEFGDTLWYFTALCRRLGIDVDTILSEVVNQNGYSKRIDASDLLDGPVSHISSVSVLPDLDNKMLPNLGGATAALLGIKSLDERTHDLLRTFSNCYLQALQATHLSFSKIVRMNMRKVRGRFLDPDPSILCTFDSEFPDEERLPQHFEIKIKQRKSGRSRASFGRAFRPRFGEPLPDRTPASCCRRQALKFEPYRPSRRSNAPSSPGWLHRSASRTIRRL